MDRQGDPALELTQKGGAGRLFAPFPIRMRTPHTSGQDRETRRTMGSQLILTLERMMPDGSWEGVYTTSAKPYIKTTLFYHLRKLESQDYQLFGLLSGVRTRPQWGPLLDKGWPPHPSPLVEALRGHTPPTGEIHTPGWATLKTLRTHLATGPDNTHATHSSLLALFSAWMDDLEFACLDATSLKWLENLPLIGPFPGGEHPPFSFKGSAHDKLHMTRLLPHDPETVRICICYHD